LTEALAGADIVVDASNPPVVDGQPYTVLRATQFFECAEQIADWNTTQDTIRLPATRMRPVASDDVVSALTGLVRSGPVEPVLEGGGPEEVGLDEFVRRVLLLHHDPRYILADPAASPIGFNLQADVLLPAAGFRAADTTLAAWIESRRVHERVNTRTR
jgi:hypothetical protein